MTSLLRTPLAIVWFVLVAATCLSWVLGSNHGLSASTGTTTATVGVLVIAFVKVRFIGLWFMELRTAPRILRLAFEGWVYLASTILTGIYLLA